MSWSDILKKNDKEFQKTIIKKDIVEIKDCDVDPNIKDADEEFDFTYRNNIKIELKEIIEHEALPFMNSSKLNDYNFYDFIKYNSENFDKIILNIEKDNNNYIEEHEYNDEDNYTEYENEN